MYSVIRYSLKNTEEAIKNVKSRDTDIFGYTRQRKTKQKHKTSRFNVDWSVDDMNPEMTPTTYLKRYNKHVSLARIQCVTMSLSCIDDIQV